MGVHDSRATFPSDSLCSVPHDTNVCSVLGMLERKETGVGKIRRQIESVDRCDLEAVDRVADVLCRP